MQRITITPRPDWQDKIHNLGLSYAFDLAADGGDIEPYWNESACYHFTPQQIDELELAAQQLHIMCLNAVEHVITHQLYDRFKIPADFVPYIEQSWAQRHPFIFGRFDLSYDGTNPPKLLEYNADTPTSLPEAAVAQWQWFKDKIATGELPSNTDQFNSIHEALIDAWKKVAQETTVPQPIYFTCDHMRENGQPANAEDFLNVEYMRETCHQAGIATARIDLKDVGWNGASFTDLAEQPIRAMFKLEPWERITLPQSSFGRHFLRNETGVIEPVWKMLLSNKALLTVLWELYPDHPNLLPSFAAEQQMQDYLRAQQLPQDYVIKPILGREGANVTIVRNGVRQTATDGIYGAEGFVYQAFKPLPDFDGHHPVIGAWITGADPDPDYELPSHPRGGRACGIGIRESSSLVTANGSQFVPHYML
jgi:glutathionylspermidine synthase